MVCYGISETRFEDSCVVVDFTNDEFIICISNTIASYDLGINEITENLLLMLNEVDKTRLQKSQAMWDSLSLEYNQIYVGMIYEGKYLGGRESELSYYVLLKEMRKSQYNTLKILYYSVIRSR